MTAVIFLPKSQPRFPASSKHKTQMANGGRPLCLLLIDIWLRQGFTRVSAMDASQRPARPDQPDLVEGATGCKVVLKHDGCCVHAVVLRELGLGRATV
jgi:hypothetical protein